MRTGKSYSVGIWLAAVGALLPGIAVGLPQGEGKDQEGATFFERRVRPVLVEHCYECHSEAEDERKGGLLLDREAGWLEGGDSGKAVVPGNLEASLLITAVRYDEEDFEMPPKYQLESGEVAILEEWLMRGAPGPADDMGETAFFQLGDQEVLFEEAKEHWAFQPVDAEEPPVVEDGAWSGTAIDRFVFAAMREQGLAPSRRAEDDTLVRRLSYDLIGLPPEEEWYELGTEELVARLLESPRFGEHFARMWLDVSRYADTANTYRADTKTPHYYPYAFTYRDYVIEAFNEDKPYGQFIREQLAADMMGFDGDAPELAALGFLGVSAYRNMSDDFVDDAIDVTTRGLLGLTAACARCHDHKFEPIPTADYYALHGVFSSVERPEPWKLEDFPLIRGYEAAPEARSEYEKRRAAVDAKIKEAGNKKSGGNNRSVADTIRQTELAELLLFHDGGPVRAMSVLEKEKPVEATIFLRGDSRQRGEKVPRRFLEVLDPEREAFPVENSGRLALAERIADAENPLTARVFVNRVWGVLMGSYLVGTPSDFGFQGEAPTHPGLLDWLAADFVAHGGSLKHLVRRIVSSKTYQQASLVREDMAATDPGNRYLWRANAKRLQIEELRDSMLAVSGKLDTRMRGRGGWLWGEEYSQRRSIYGYINRFNLDPVLRNFDFPSPVQSQEERTEDIVAPQALFTMNAPFVIDQSKAVVETLGFDEGLGRRERVDAIYEKVLHRESELAERERIDRFIDLQEEREINPWPLVAQALMMSNEFLYVD